MKTLMILTAVALFGMCAAPTVNSQAASEEAATLAALQALKTGNQELQQRQEKTMKTLEELRAAAAQVRMLGKRT
jgi:Spy/CpxP family protein refolding chaperone